MFCFIHGFSTNDVEKWDRHCYYTGHTITVYENGEKITEPYPRHHMRDAIARGEAIFILGDEVRREETQAVE